MPTPVVYDDASFHLGAPSFSNKRISPLNAGTHIGMYLAWIIINRLESFKLRQTAAAAVEEVRSKQKTGRELLFEHLQGRFTSEELNKDGQAFTALYYENQYLRDYDEVLVDQKSKTYSVADTWANYDRIAKLIDSRLRDFRGIQPAAAS